MKSSKRIVKEVEGSEGMEGMEGLEGSEEKEKKKRKRPRFEFPRPRFSETAFDVAPDEATLLSYANPTGLKSVSHLRFADSMVFQKKLDFPADPIIVEHGLAVGRFFPDSSRFVVGDDAGELNVYRRHGDSWKETLERFRHRRQAPARLAKAHSGPVRTLDVMPVTGEVVSGGEDHSIVICDPVASTSTVSIEDAHDTAVSGVAANPHTPGIFISCGQDGQIALWDMRAPPKGASQTEESIGPIFDCTDRNATSIAWTTEKRFLVGYDNGKVMHIDISQPNSAFSRGSAGFPISKISYSEIHNRFAVCGKSNFVEVYKLHGGRLVLDMTYAPFEQDITGLAWNPKQPMLYACSWQGKVHRRKV